MFLIGGPSGNVEFVKNEDFENSLRVMSPNSEVTSLAFSDDGALLACGANDTTPFLYSILKDENMKVKPGHESSILNVFFDPTSTLLCTTGCEGMLHIYSVELILMRSSNSLLRAQKICRDTKLFQPQQLKSAW